MNKTKVILVVGPTAVGKSDAAVEICLRVGGEVISADSMQVYQGMDVGTAKLTPQEQQGVPHHLLDIVTPTTDFTVARWKELADEMIAQVAGRGAIPVVCGGTGLYVRAITDDLTFSSQPRNEAIREKWQTYAERHGREALYEALVRADPESARRLHQNDVKRVIRALEIAETSPQLLSEDYDWSVQEGRYDVLLIGLWMEREALYQRVEERVDKMVAMGLIDEVKKLLDAGVTPEHSALQAIGYKEIVSFLRGASSEEEAVSLIKRNTRRFVKRQLSWFRRDPRIEWFERLPEGEFASGEKDRLWRIIEDFLAGFREITHE